MSLQLGSLFEQMATRHRPSPGGRPEAAAERLRTPDRERGQPSNRAGHAGPLQDAPVGACWCSRWARLPPPLRCRATGARRSSRSAAASCSRAIALFAVRTVGGSVVTDALADAPNAHAVADDVWAIATSLLVDVAERQFPVRAVPGPRRLARGRGAPRDGDPALLRVFHARASRPRARRPRGRDPAARHLGAGSVDPEALGDRDLHGPRIPLARARPPDDARAVSGRAGAEALSSPALAAGRRPRR